MFAFFGVAFDPLLLEGCCHRRSRFGEVPLDEPPHLHRDRLCLRCGVLGIEPLAVLLKVLLASEDVVGGVLLQTDLLVPVLLCQSLLVGNLLVVGGPPFAASYPNILSRPTRLVGFCSGK